MESRGTEWANVFLPLALIAGLVVLLEIGVGYLVVAAEGAAAIVIGIAVLRAFVDFTCGSAVRGARPRGSAWRSAACSRSASS